MRSSFAGRAAGRRRVPFFGHSLAEYLLAAALIASGLHASDAAELVLVLAGAALVLLNVATVGPLGAFHLLGRRGHHVADGVLIALLVVVPLVALREVHLLGMLAAEVVALILLRIERTTRYLDLPAPRGAGRAAATAAAGPGLAAAGTGTGQAARSGSRGAAESAGALAAGLAPVAGRAARGGARRLGLVAGVTKRVVRESTARGRDGRPPAS